MRCPRHRCQIIGSIRHRLAEAVDELVQLARSEQRTEDIETVASELIPLADALDWIRQRGPKTIADRKVGLSGRPAWMWGVRSVVQRVPLGRVLILGTWNYPIFLTGVQMAQALAAGNSVLVKPAPGTEALTMRLIEMFHQAGVPPTALVQIGSDTQSAISAMAGENGNIDLVVLTGSAATGRKVLQQAAETLTPSIMELSGVDAVVALPKTDWNRLTKAVEFGLMFNSGATCIGPRRLMFESRDGQAQNAIRVNLVNRLKRLAPVAIHPAARQGIAAAVESAMVGGATDLIGKFDAEKLQCDGVMHPVVLSGVHQNAPILQTDLFAPVISLLPMTEMGTAIELVNGCPYRLAASVFGPTGQAEAFAKKLTVGCVTVNDLVAPTADPRLPFGGRGDSGFGVTRGPEGLLAMTATRVIAVRRGRIAPHLSTRNDSDADLLAGVLQIKHAATLRQRVAAVSRVVKARRNR